MQNKLETLSVVLEMLGEVTSESKKSAIKLAAKKAQVIIKGELKGSLGYEYRNYLTNAFEATTSLSKVRYGNKNAMMIRLEYARENLKTAVDMIKKEGL